MSGKRIPQIPFSDYQKADGIRSSLLKAVYEGGTAAHGLTMGSKTSDALADGSAAHCLVMRPGDFDAEFVVGAEADCGKKRDTKKCQAFIKENPGKTVILENNLANVRIYSEAARNHPRVKKFLAKGVPEVAYFAEDPEFGGCQGEVPSGLDDGADGCGLQIYARRFVP